MEKPRKAIYRVALLHQVEHGPGACNADAIHESELQNLVVQAINMALGQKDTMYDVLQRNVEAVPYGNRRHFSLTRLTQGWKNCRKNC